MTRQNYIFEEFRYLDLRNSQVPFRNSLNYRDFENLGSSQYPKRNLGILPNYRDFEKFLCILKMTNLRFPLGIWEVPKILKGI